MSQIHLADAPKNERLETRCSADQKALIARAAALSGRTVTDFANSTLIEAATRIIREHEVISLNARDSKAFVAALLEPPSPGKRLRKAGERNSGSRNQGILAQFISLGIRSKSYLLCTT